MADTGSNNTPLSAGDAAGNVMRDIFKASAHTAVMMLDKGGSGAESLVTDANPLNVMMKGAFASGVLTSTGNTLTLAVPEGMSKATFTFQSNSGLANLGLYIRASTDGGATYITQYPDIATGSISYNSSTLVSTDRAIGQITHIQLYVAASSGVAVTATISLGSGSGMMFITGGTLALSPLGSTQIGNSTYIVGIKAPSTAPVAADPALVVALSPNSASPADLVVTGTITTQNLNPLTGTPTAGSFIVIGPLAGACQISVEVLGTYTGAITPQLSGGGSTYVNNTLATAVTNSATGTMSATIPSASPGVYEFNSGGATYVRLSANAAVTGTANLRVSASNGSSLLALDAPIPGTTAVSLATNTPTLAAGTNNAGGMVPRNVATTNGYTRTPFTSAANTNGTVLKASPGTLVRFRLRNVAAYSVFIRFYNSTTVTVGTTTPAFPDIEIAAGATMSEDYVDGGEFFSTGICFSATKATGNADTTAIAAGDLRGFITSI